MFRPLNRAGAAFVAAGLVCVQAALANVTVRFDPLSTTVPVGGTFTVNIVADIPQPVVGWGLDLTIQNPTVVSQTAVPSIGPLWVPAYAPDGDGLAAVAFPGGISGTGVVLATLTLSANAIGQTDLWLSVTPGDLNEGFALAPTGFADVTFQPGHVTVPEPGTALLLLAAGLVTVRRGRASGRR